MNVQTAGEKIRDFFTLHKRIPSYQEMCTLFGYASKRASFELAKKLIAAGILEKDHKGRLVLVDIVPTLPLLGSIKAGFPTSANDVTPETIAIHEYLVNKPLDSYLLKVSGDSMIDAGIFPGDLVVVEKKQEAREDDIVVALIDGEQTLKYLRRIDGKICLVAANAKYPPFFPETSLTIWGTVVAVIRKYN